jgi:branched-chain amino acid transport system permease protein
VIAQSLSSLARGLLPRTGATNTRSLTVYVILAAVLLATAPALDIYTKMILTVSFIYGLTAISIDLLWGYAGVLSYAHGALFGIGAYAVAITATTRGDGLMGTVLLGGAIGIVVACLVALAVGGLSFHSRADWLYVGVVSFAVPFIFERLTLAGGEVTGSSSGLSAFLQSVFKPTQWYLLTGIILLVVLFGATVLVRSDTGTLFKAIRENEMRCTYLGIRVNRVKNLLFTATAALTAFAGALLASSQNVVAPDLGGIMAATMMVIWVALGGRGTLIGPVIAAVVIDYVTAIIGAEFPFIWQLGLGVAFLLVVLYLPGRLMSLLQAPLALLARRFAWARPDERAAELEIRVGQSTSGPTNRDDQPVLQLKDVTCRFAAVSGVDIQAGAGEIVSIVGPNGAGKSTLMRCISNGTYRTAGSVRVGGESIKEMSPARVAALGVSQKFQHASVFGALNVGECLRIARASALRPSLWRRERILELPPSAVRVLEATGLSEMLSVPAEDLSHGQKQALELAMVMSTDPKVVLLDEPTAGLSHEERTVLGTIFRQIAAEEGKLVILVEHDLDFVREISSRILVLHQGRLLLDGSVEEVANSKLVQEIYTGTFDEQELADARES